MSDIVDPIIPPPVITDPVPPVVEDELAGILTKYENDPRKIAKSYRDLQRHSDSLAAKYVPPPEYVFPTTIDSLDDFAKSNILETAKTGRFTQDQFNVLAERVNATAKDLQSQSRTHVEDLTNKRQAVLGDSSEVSKFKSFYAGKIPDEVLDEVVSKGDPEVIKKLKDFRDYTLNKQTSPALGDRMTIDVGSIHETIQTKQQELVELSGQRRVAPVQKQAVLDAQINRKAQEITDLKGQLK